MRCEKKKKKMDKEKYRNFTPRTRDEVIAACRAAVARVNQRAAEARVRLAERESQKVAV